MGACGSSCGKRGAPGDVDAPTETQAGSGNGKPGYAGFQRQMQDDGSLLSCDVVIRGLRDRPDLEGERGSVIMWDEYEGFYTVSLERFTGRKILAKGYEMHPIL